MAGNTMATISAVSPEREDGRMTMDGMTKHSRNLRHAAPDDRPPQAHARAAAWLVLAVAGATMVSFNMWHAIHGGIPLLLAVLYGIAPVALALGLSHVVAAYNGGWFMKGTTFVIMLGAMVLSVRATGYVVKPATGDLWPLFGAVVDAAALVALQVILSPESRAAAKAAKRAAREALLNATLGAAEPAVPQASVPAAGHAIPQAAGEPWDEPAGAPAGEPDREPSRKPLKVSNEPDAVKARAEYRRSVRAGTPLTDRALAAKFPGRGRTWAANRIAEVSAGPQVAARTGTW
jgi:hypothetical protein